MRTSVKRTLGTSVVLAAAAATLVSNVETGNAVDGADHEYTSVYSGPFDVAGWTEYAQCLRKHGVDARNPDPKPEANSMFARMADGSALPVTDPAFKTCESRAGKGNTVSLYVSPEDMKRHRDFSACVREHGLPDYPDPDPRTALIPDMTPFTKKHFNAAWEACHALAPQGPAGG
ncbi:hypothetical protein OIE69_35695 [Actinacidiphila glaucinigra]|uniref:hypothetical protein n=1 Tax=Actinacidiphila glaucinigra TaxID=235986 RepID=UPI002DDAB328|nr:hypothetical protein [Actinacidiphila glaucinigra]WSD63858.1 hypothetical protein OIE69_35695 [Actinacidiphila glaucinigra]